ncbi:hypothetical protein ACFQO4_19345 [Saliphagus sp. GCM10025334]|uniref:hypothetical protein n=1 Tax=Natronosalvus caseinilyticus TaxID=2953747 RepID=UPI0028A5BE33|nr:hypothetical protein [Natronosalvus caseinilyticus]
MASLTRRKILQWGGVPFVLGASGCTSLGVGSPKEPRLTRLTVSNHDFEAHTVYALIVDDDEPVFWGAMDVEAADPDSNHIGGGGFEGYSAESGAYVLYAWRDDQPQSDWKRSDFSEYDGSCFALNIQIGTVSGDRTGEVSLWSGSTLCGDERSGEHGN